MALGDHLRRQEDRARELQLRLDELAHEYAEQMRLFGVLTVPVVDTTAPGEHNSYSDGDGGGGSYTAFVCGMTGVRAWPLVSEEMSVALFSLKSSWDAPHFCLAVTETGRLLLTESYSQSGPREVAVSYLDLPEHSWSLIYRYAREHAGLTSWAEARNNSQFNILLEWAERAHIHGLETVVLPIEHAMLHQVNQLKRR